jgi:hypothetical protein
MIGSFFDKKSQKIGEYTFHIIKLVMLNKKMNHRDTEAQRKIIKYSLRLCVSVVHF